MSAVKQCRKPSGQYKKCGSGHRAAGKSPVISRAKVLAQKIHAPNDSNGNPRRGWLVYGAGGKFLGFVTEGYLGDGALFAAFPKAIKAWHAVATTPKQYREFARGAVYRG